MQIFNSTVLAALFYGCEAWAPDAHHLQRLHVFHNRCLRSLLGVCRADHISNASLFRRCGTAEARTLLARRQLRWLGHLGRMGDERIAKQALYCTMRAPGRTRHPGCGAQRLADHFADLASKVLPPPAQLRKLFPAARGQRNWHAVCQDRALWHQLCAAFH